jgi:hypothetical protein
VEGADLSGVVRLEGVRIALGKFDKSPNGGRDDGVVAIIFYFLNVGATLILQANSISIAYKKMRKL